MKAEIALSIGAGLLAVTLVTAGAKIPTGTFAASDLAAACEEASKARQGVALLLADSTAKQEKAVDATKGAVRSLKGHSVVVFIESKGGDMGLLPPPAMTALQDIKLGVFIPRVAVTSPDLLEVWSVGSGTELGGERARKALTRIKSEAGAKAAGWKPGASGIDPRQQVFKWGGAEKGHFEGRFESLGEDGMNLVDKNGRKGSIELEKLSAASIAFAKTLQALAGNAAAPTFEVESWTSSDGRTLKARFVSLDDGKITLEIAGGKKATFPLTRLDKAGAQRAHEHAAAVVFATGE